MGMALAFSTLTLVSLFLYFIYFVRRYLPRFIRESTLFNHVVIISTFLEWACDFCLRYSLFPFHHYVPNIMLAASADAGIECTLCTYEVEEGEEMCGFCLETWARYTNHACPLCRSPPPELTGSLVSEIYRRSLTL
ncbi:RING-H2 finger protein 2B [Hibiscus trionum]|uniref:RING-H2 finger protein 2B n=1 Tax=Hibiscus trionum TaxID=183268 RepID=A0A9W7HCN6_HIBTR|nr:RING-H2 finger protein 2B [Hibiscus trionum]